MRNIHDYKQFLEIKKLNEEPVYEFLGLGKLFKNLFNKAKQYIQKVQGAKEIEALYNKQLDLLKQEIKAQTGIELVLNAEEQMKAAEQKAKTPTGGEQKTAGAETKQNTSENISYVYEAAEDAGAIPKEAVKSADGEEKNTDNADAQKTVKSLQAKNNAIMQKIDIIKKRFVKDANAIADKNLVASKEDPTKKVKNPDLLRIIDIKQDEFELAYLNAIIQKAEEAGDKNIINKVGTEVNKVNKKIEATLNQMGKGSFIEIEVNGKKLKVGAKYPYNKDGKFNTIEIIKKSDKPDKVIAKFTYGDSKDKEQDFTVDNIEDRYNDKNIQPKEGEKYNYFSETNNAAVEVKIISVDATKNIAEVQTDVEGSKPFKTSFGKLLDKTKDAEETKKEEEPTEAAK